MPLKNTVDQYGSISKWLHWLITLGVFINLFIGFFHHEFTKPIAANLMLLHKSVGLTVLTLAIIAVLWRWINPKPAWPITMPQWQQALARATHATLYLLIILMPLSGWIMSTAADKAPKFFGLFIAVAPGIPIDRALAKTSNELHEIMGLCIVVFVCIHIIGALKHHFIDKDNILRRVLPSFSHTTRSQ